MPRVYSGVHEMVNRWGTENRVDSGHAQTEAWPPAFAAGAVSRQLSARAPHARGACSPRSAREARGPLRIRVGTGGPQAPSRPRGQPLASWPARPPGVLVRLVAALVGCGRSPTVCGRETRSVLNLTSRVIRWAAVQPAAQHICQASSWRISASALREPWFVRPYRVPRFRPAFVMSVPS